MATTGTSPGGGINARFAGRVHPGPDAKLLAPYLDGATYLTKFTQVIQLPSSIEQDITFVRSTNNESFRETVVVIRDRLVFVGPATMLLFVLVAVAMVVVSARRRRSREAAA